MPTAPNYRPDPVFPSLGQGFADEVAPASFPRHTLRYRNDRWAVRLGLETLSNTEWTNHFGAFHPLPENIGPPLAMRYHGHQFRTYNPDIGDGRGFLYAQLKDMVDHRLLDLATKGSGKTPYSRTADGRLTLKGGVREALITALLEALGVYTSKTFSLIETGEDLHRHDEPSPARSSVLVRLSHSHIRFGTFQRHAYEKNSDRLRQLVDFAVDNYFPHLDDLDGDEKVAAFLGEVTKRTAALVASWMAAGFVHGVLNTDNMNITGESFDYGPYRMLTTFDPRMVAAYFDEYGIYAYGRQPSAVFWNLKQLAGALSPICDADGLAKALEPFAGHYSAALVGKTLARLGLEPDTPETDAVFVTDCLNFLQASQVRYERFFFDLYGGPSPRLDGSPYKDLYRSDHFKSIRRGVAQRAPINTHAHDALYFQKGIPCTLLIDEIEALWTEIAENDDWTAFYAKLDDIEDMRQALQTDAQPAE